MQHESSGYTHLAFRFFLDIVVIVSILRRYSYKLVLYYRFFVGLTAALLFSFLCSCGGHTHTSPELERALSESGRNRKEVEKLLKHYSVSGQDSLKLQAVYFLIENMYAHFSILDSAYNTYRAEILKQEMPIATPLLNSLWNNKHKIHKTKDLESITASALIKDIDEAFAIRERSKWRDSIGFREFLHYILPYKVDDELFVPGWRSVLYDRYYDLIDGITDPKVAFAKVKTHIRSRSYTREAKSNFSHSIDPLTMDYLRRGSCAQLDIYTISVLRALHIPAAYDYIETWGNYSQVGHSWPAYIASSGATYTLDKEDSILRRFNRIDASYFKEHAEPIAYPLHVSQFKTVYKVYRRDYALQKNEEIATEQSNHKLDVSIEYGLNGTIEEQVGANISHAGLSVFRTGAGWHEFAQTVRKDDKVSFSGLGKNVMYLITAYDSLGLSHIGDPFYLDENNVPQYFHPKDTTGEITLYRKYPLFGTWTAQWQRMLGAKLEVGRSRDFKTDSKEIYHISKTPAGKIIISAPEISEYTALRYVCPLGGRTPIAEMILYDHEGMVLKHGIPIGDKIADDQLHLAFDGDVLTNPAIKNEGYWIGLDFSGKKDPLRELARIEIVPKNDGNFISKGDQYALFYFDKQWVKAYEDIASTDSLVVDNVPLGAVYWLRNMTKGMEERIFTIYEGQQIWW